MASIAVAFPVLPGKTDAARELFRITKNEKWNEYVKSQKRDGVDKGRDFLQSTPAGDMVILYIESKDINHVFAAFAKSKEPFDVWVKEEIKKITGVDFSQPPSGPLPELMLSYDS